MNNLKQDMQAGGNISSCKDIFQYPSVILHFLTVLHGFIFLGVVERNKKIYYPLPLQLLISFPGSMHQ